METWMKDDGRRMIVLTDEELRCRYQETDESRDKILKSYPATKEWIDRHGESVRISRAA